MKFTVPHAGSSTRLQDIILARMKRIHHNVNRASENCSSSQAEPFTRGSPGFRDSIYFPRTRKGRTRSHANALSVDELFGIHDICPVLGREHPDRQGIHSNHRSEDVLALVELPRVPHLGELWRGERTPNENTLSQEARVTKGSDDRPGTVVRRARATRTSASEHTRAQRPLSGAARVAAAVLFFRWAPPREKRSKAKSSSVLFLDSNNSSFTV